MKKATLYPLEGPKWGSINATNRCSAQEADGFVAIGRNPLIVVVLGN